MFAKLWRVGRLELRSPITLKSFGAWPIVVINVPHAESLVGTSGGQHMRRSLDAHGKPECAPELPQRSSSVARDGGPPDVAQGVHDYLYILRSPAITRTTLVGGDATTSQSFLKAGLLPFFQQILQPFLRHLGRRIR